MPVRLFRLSAVLALLFFLWTSVIVAVILYLLALGLISKADASMRTYPS